MKKYLLLSFSLLFQLVYGQNQFQHIYGGVNHERGQTLLETYNNRYLFNGATTSYGQGSADAIMIKTDNAAQILWAKVYGLSDFDNSEFAIESPDGGYVGVGRSTTAIGSGFTDAWIFKTDSNGVLQWSKAYGNNGTNDGFVQAINSIGGFTFVGNTRSIGAGSDDVFLVHTDLNGDTIFTRSYGTPELEIGIGVIQTANGDYVICGRQVVFTNGIPESDGVILRTDINGNLLWSKLYGDSLWEEFQSIREMPNGDLVIAGSTVSFGAGDYDILVVRTDANGQLISDYAYGGPKTDAAYNLIVNPDLSMVLSGYTEGLGYGHRTNGDDSTNVFLLKVQEDGTLDWMMTYGDGLLDEAYRSAKTSDGGYMISGYTTDYTPQDSTQMLFVKTDANGLSGCHEQPVTPIFNSVLMHDTLAGFLQSSVVNVSNANSIELTINPINNDACLFASINDSQQLDNISVFPNPFTNQLVVDFKANKVSTLCLSDIQGRIVICKNVSNQKEFTFDTSSLESGIYFLKISSSSQQEIFKVVK